MAFLRANLVFIAIGVVCLLSIGVSGWAYTRGAPILENVKKVNDLVSQAGGLARSPHNKTTIEAKAEEIEMLKAEYDRSMADALALQKFNPFYERADANGEFTRVPREPLVPGVLPTSRDAVRIEFTGTYKNEFQKLPERLHGRGAPTREEILKHEAQVEQLDRPDNEGPKGPWIPRVSPKEDDKEDPKKNLSLPELLRKTGKARAADEVARSISMYVDEGALGMHELASAETAPSPVQIWQAQMSLWIQQDIVTALARCNEQRAAELRRQGVPEPYWVAHMPVKRLMRFSIDDALGNGGGSNLMRCHWAVSFTGTRNNNRMFMVPLQLEVVIEEAALMDLMESICRVGFYTPISVKYEAVPADPTLKELFIYGEEPIIHLTLDLEGYYFREVFEEWIPKSLKEVLKKKGALAGKRG